MVQPMAKIGGSIFAGMLVASFFVAKHQIYIALALFLIGCIVFYVFKRHKSLGVLLVIAGIAAGYIGLYTTLVFTPSTALDSTEAIIQGTVIDKETRTDGTYSYTVKVNNINGDRIKFAFNMKVYSDKNWYCNYYDSCKFATTVYSTSDNEQLSLEDYQKSNSIFLTASLDDEDYVSIDRNDNFHLRRTLLQFRDTLMDNINNYLDSPESELMVGMLFGKTSAISSAIRLDFKQAGFSHMLAVSGLHLSVLASFLVVVLRGLEVSRKVERIISIGFILCFMFMAGCTASIIRASIMAIIASSGSLISHRADGLNSLGVAATIILLVSPYSIMSISFLLSFSATLGILVMSQTVTNKITNHFTVKRHFAKMIVDSFSVSFCATLFTIPVTVMAFNQLVLIAPISNLIAVPFGTLALVFGIVTSVMGLIPLMEPITALFGYIAQSLIWVLRNLASFFAGFPSVPLGYDYVYIWLGLSLLLILTALMLKSTFKTKALVMVSCVLMFMIASTVFNYVTNGDVTVTMIRSYYGYSTVIIQDRHAIVINCGGGSNSGTQVVQYLQSRGVSQVDAIILTNGYKSGAQGVPDILESFEVDRVIVPDKGTMKGEIVKSGDETEIVKLESMELTGYSSEIHIDDTYSRAVVYGKVGRLNFAYGEYSKQIKQISQEETYDVVVCLEENMDELVNFSFEYGIILSNGSVKLLFNGTVYESTNEITTLRCDKTGAVSIRS